MTILLNIVKSRSGGGGVAVGFLVCGSLVGLFSLFIGLIASSTISLCLNKVTVFLILPLMTKCI